MVEVGDDRGGLISPRAPAVGPSTNLLSPRCSSESVGVFFSFFFYFLGGWGLIARLLTSFSP